MYGTEQNITSLPIWAMLGVITLAIWSMVWKCISLWHAARNNSRLWFIILLIFNTAGILDLIYIFGVAKIKTDKLFK